MSQNLYVRVGLCLTAMWLGGAIASTAIGSDDANKTDFIPWTPSDSAYVAPLAGCGGCTTQKDCEETCRRGRVFQDSWASLDYMFTWRKDRHVPALATTSPPGSNGLLPDAQVLFGNGGMGGSLKSGGRLSLGTWLDECDTIGLGARFFAGENDVTSFGVASDAAGSPLLARPFFNTNPGQNAQDALLLSVPGIRGGDISIRASNEVTTTDLYFRYLLRGCQRRRLDLIAGYQFSRIDDSLTIRDQMTQIAGGFPAGTQFTFDDAFHARNEFHGGVLGLCSEYNTQRFTFSMLGKVGLGNMHEMVHIRGTSSQTLPGQASVPFDGGLLALPTNSDPYQADRFTVVPEVELKLAYHVNHHVDVSLGYSFIYWSNVALAGNQIDVSQGGFPTSNASQLLGGNLVGPANPALNGIRNTDFWMQGINLGLTLKR